MSNLLQRALTGLVFVAVIVGLVYWGEWGFSILLFLIGLGGLYEFYSIVFERKPKGIDWIFIILGIILILFERLEVYIESSYYYGHYISFVFSVALLSGVFMKDWNWKTPALYLSGILYIALPLFLFSLIPYTYPSCGLGEYKPGLALNVFVLIWCSDTFAYLCGRLFGKHKLFERISPKKTWEGFIGAILLTLAFSVQLADLFQIPRTVNLLLAFVTVVFGSLGDLVESKLKREFNIKDSGHILPGHGGVLDRFDALFIALPFVLIVYEIFMPK